MGMSACGVGDIEDPGPLEQMFNVTIPREVFYERGFVCITDKRFLKDRAPLKEN